MRLYIKAVWSFLAIWFIAGCAGSSESTEEFNKPALYWYKQIAKSIANGNMDKADNYYISLRSEHMRSVQMPTAIMMLAHAHMHDEKYLLSTYYLDEYSKRYAEYQNDDYIAFMKLKASFLGIQDVYKDQKLILDTIEKSKRFAYRYPESIYVPMVHHMLIRLHMSQYLLNENIAALYERTGKPKAAKIYRDKNRGSLVNLSDITAPKQGIVGKIFD